MLKLFAIVSVVAAFLLAGPRVAQGQGSGPHATASKVRQKPETVPPTHVVIDPPMPISAYPPSPVSQQQPTKENPLPWLARPEWVIVWVTMVYAVITWLTLRKIKQQADTMAEQAKDFRDSSASSSLIAQQTLAAIQAQAAHLAEQVEEMKAQTAVAQASADAALLNAKSLINAERPWLLENIVRVGDSDHEWAVSVRNAGNTPADVVNGYWCLSTLSGDSKLPVDYERHYFLIQNTVIVRADSFEVVEIDSRRYHDRALGGFQDPGGGDYKLLYLYGEVEYWDTFSDRSSPITKPHVTQ